MSEKVLIFDDNGSNINAFQNKRKQPISVEQKIFEKTIIADKDWNGKKDSFT